MTAEIALRLATAGTQQISAREWKRIVQTYQAPDVGRSTRELVVTAVPFVVLWTAAYISLAVGYWLTLIFAFGAALFLLRLFLIQHDCGHQALFKSQVTNDWVGRVIGVLTMTPYDNWRRSHAIHHACSGNLDRRGIGDILTLTVDEYRALPWHRKLQYYLYRHPAVMFGVGPAYVFLIAHRWPVGRMTGEGWWPWTSTMGTNAAIAVLLGTMIYFLGFGAVLMVHIPIVLIAATIGVWLFYVQHQFEDTQWEETRHWSQEEAALYGSSFYDLPPLLSWFSANIGIHHVHHLYSRIPFYRLPEVLRDHPQLAGFRRITTLEGIRTLRLKLWDPNSRRLVSFNDARRLPASLPAPAPKHFAAAE